ncbi:MAG TPA: prepilin-type N-terminal cleavage/methylation domain-containing protein, partial [Gemmatimonadales bacterium]|nr:prepilin-type N-terminal cleavage/methylation domain-containing protein [Gemmatimonadales bacterium]
MRTVRPPWTPGVTLLELMVALVMLGLVASLAMRLLIATQRTTAAQAVRATLQGDLRAASAVVSNELWMLGQSDSTDILDVTDTSIVYRAMRGYYVLCEALTGGASITMLRVLPSAFSFDYRAPAAGDSLLLFYEADPLTLGDDRWHRARIARVAGSTCRSGAWKGAPALVATFDEVVPGTPALYLVGAPIRTYEIARLSVMSSGGRTWLGMCTGGPGCTLEPVAGPLASRGGLQITRYDDADAVVAGNSFADRNALRTLELRLVGASERAIGRGGGDNGPLGTIQD